MSVEGDANNLADGEALEMARGDGREMIAWKRGHPADDLLSALINAEEDGDKLSDDGLVAQVLLLYAAGHETTVGLIGNGVAALLQNPDQLDRLRIDRGDARHHVSLGTGPHRCLGAALEGQVAIGRLVRRFDSLAQAGEVTWGDRIELRNATVVPISV